MLTTARALMMVSAGIILMLGVVHLAYTFYGPKLMPRDTALKARMQAVSPVITRQTDMWRAWVGFNASHSMGAIMFGLLFMYLAAYQPALLFQSAFLTALGLAMLGGYFLLGWKYWFSVPWAGITAALALFVASLICSRF